MVTWDMPRDIASKCNVILTVDDDTKTINYPNSNPLTNDSMKLILKKELFEMLHSNLRIGGMWD